MAVSNFYTRDISLKFFYDLWPKVPKQAVNLFLKHELCRICNVNYSKSLKFHVQIVCVRVCVCVCVCVLKMQIQIKIQRSMKYIYIYIYLFYFILFIYLFIYLFIRVLSPKLRSDKLTIFQCFRVAFASKKKTIQIPL